MNDFHYLPLFDYGEDKTTYQKLDATLPQIEKFSKSRDACY